MLVLLVVNLAFAASWQYTLLPLGRWWRWPMFFDLAVLSFAYALWRRPRVRLPLAPYAAATALIAMALGSALWSGDPRRTLHRGIAFAVLVASAGAIAYALAGRTRAVERVLFAILIGAGVVSLLGLLALANYPHSAVQPATAQYPARYQGIGENPNTISMIEAVAIPLALWALVRARSTRGRILAAAALLLFDGSIVAASSRGALVGAAVAVVVWVLLLPRLWSRRLVLLVAVAALLALDVGVMAIPSAKSAPAHSGKPSTPRTQAFLRNAELNVPIEDELGRNGKPVRRTLLGSSGRSVAWDAALRQAAHRPIAGYGFGMEERAFADRFVGFQSGLPENSYIGTLLQLGVAGLLALLAALASFALVAARLLPRLDGRARAAAAAATAVLAAGAALAVTQSYVTSVGNLATASVWTCCFLLVSLAAQPRVQRRRAEQGEEEEERANRDPVAGLDVRDRIQERVGDQEHGEPA